jgi:hypothetical protein
MAAATLMPLVPVAQRGYQRSWSGNLLMMPAWINGDQSADRARMSGIHIALN